MKQSKAMKSIFAVIGATLMMTACAACSACGYTPPTSSSNSNFDNPFAKVTLSTPKNLSFDYNTMLLSWTPVDNANGYLVDYNGMTTTVTEAQMTILLTAEQNVFKVKALGDVESYNDSEWSEAITYENPKEELSVFDKVNLKLAEAATAENLTLERVIGVISTDLEANQYGSHVTFQVVCRKKDVSYNYEFGFRYENPSSVAEMLQSFDKATFKGKLQKDIVTKYNSAQYLVNSGLYVGTMKELKESGHTISVIDSVVREGQKVGSKFRFEIVGTFKAQAADDVIYFTAVYRVDALNPSSDDSYNYELFLAAEDLRDLYEVSCLLHRENETLLYMNAWAKANDVHSTTL